MAKDIDLDFGDNSFSQFEPGTIIGNYKLISKLGAGGMGIVFLAQDLTLPRQVAIKFVLSFGSNQKVIDRFRREVEISASLQHPGIVQVYHVGQHEKLPYIVMEYIDGEPFLKTMQRPEVSLETKLEVLRKSALALDYAAQQNIVHRDVKPENILLRKNGDPVVMDFGIAKLSQTEKSLTKTGEVLGTIVVMSPEQAKGLRREIDHRTDIYALGAILYCILTGRYPVSGKNQLQQLMSIISATPPAPCEVNPETSPILEGICLRALEKDKNNRFARGADFASALEKFLRGEEAETGFDQSMTAYKMRSAYDRSRVVWQGMAVFLILAGLVFTSLKVLQSVEVEEQAKREQFFRQVQKRFSFIEELYQKQSYVEGLNSLRALKPTSDWPQETLFRYRILQTEGLLHTQQWKKAKVLLQKLAKKNDAQVRYWQAFLAVEEKRYIDALAILDNLTTEESFALQGKIFSLQGKKEKAEQAFQQAVTMALEPWQNLKRPEQRVEMWLKVIALYPQVVENHQQLALLYYQQLKPQKAIAQLSLAIQKEKNVRYLLQRGLWEEDLGQVGRASQDFAECWEILQAKDDDTLKLQVAKASARVLFYLQKWEQASKFYNYCFQATKEAFFLERLLWTKVRTIQDTPKKGRQKSQYKELRNLTQQFRTLFPDKKALVFYFGGHFHNFINQQSKAAELWKQALKQAGCPIEVWEDIGDAYLKKKKFVTSEKYLRKAVEKLPNMHRPLFLLSENLAKQKKYKEALSYVSQAIKLAPWIYRYYQLRANLYLRLEKRKESRIDVIKCLSINPTNFTIFNVFTRDFLTKIASADDRREFFLRAYLIGPSIAKREERFFDERLELLHREFVVFAPQEQTSKNLEKKFSKEYLKNLLKFFTKAQETEIGKEIFQVLLQVDPSRLLELIVELEKEADGLSEKSWSRVKLAISDLKAEKEKYKLRSYLLRYYYGKEIELRSEIYFQQTMWQSLAKIIADSGMDEMVRFLAAKMLGEFAHVDAETILKEIYKKNRANLTTRIITGSILRSCYNHTTDITNEDYNKEHTVLSLFVRNLAARFLKFWYQEPVVFLKDPSPTVRLQAAAQIYKSNEDAKSIVIQGMGSKVGTLQNFALKSYWQGRNFKKVQVKNELKFLRQGLNSKTASTRRFSIKILHHLHLHQSVPGYSQILQSLLKDPDFIVHFRAVFYLGLIDIKLIKKDYLFAENKPLLLRSAAFIAYEQNTDISPAQHFEFFHRLRNDKNDFVRSFLFSRMGYFYRLSGTAFLFRKNFQRIIEESIRSSDRNIRLGALMSISYLLRYNPKEFAHLIPECLNDSEENIRNYAAALQLHTLLYLDPSGKRLKEFQQNIGSKFGLDSAHGYNYNIYRQIAIGGHFHLQKLKVHRGFDWQSAYRFFALHILRVMLISLDPKTDAQYPNRFRDYEKQMLMAHQSAPKKSRYAFELGILYYCHGIAHRNQASLVKAAVHFEKAIQLENKGLYFVWLAKVHIASSQWRLAQKNLKEAHTQDPWDAEILSLQGYVLEQQKKSKEANEKYLRSRRVKTNFYRQLEGIKEEIQTQFPLLKIR